MECYREQIKKKGFDSCIGCIGCKMKTRVPFHLDELLPKLPDYDEICRKENTYRDKMAHDYNHRLNIVYRV